MFADMCIIDDLQMEYINEEQMTLDFPSQWDLQLPGYMEEQWASFDHINHLHDHFAHLTRSGEFEPGYMTPIPIPMTVFPVQTMESRTFPVYIQSEMPPQPTLRAASISSVLSTSDDNSSHHPSPEPPLVSLPSGYPFSIVQASTSGSYFQISSKPPSVNYDPVQEVAKLSPESNLSHNHALKSKNEPDNAVYTTDDEDLILAEMDRLLQYLAERRLGCKHYNAYLTCPLFDCELGGWNPLIHGAFPNNIAPDQKGWFFSSNEVKRHVQSVHVPVRDLRCFYPGCPTQKRLDLKAIGSVGYFCRIDIWRKHLKENKEHADFVPQDLKIKYKLSSL